MRILRGLAAAGAAAAVLAGCAGENAGEAGVDADRVLHRGNSDDPRTLDPHAYLLATTLPILMDLFEGLFTADAAGRPTPGLAESWTTSEDGLVWTFTLQEGRRWSDGAPITAEDVVFGMRRTVDPATLSVFSIYEMRPVVNAEAVRSGEAAPDTLGVRALDPLTVEIRLEHPVPDLPIWLYSPFLAPVPKHVVEEHGERWTRPEHMVTSGAYDLADWRTGDVLVLEKNPMHPAADAVCFDQVRYYPTVDAFAGLRRLRGGELDTLFPAPIGQAELIERELPGWFRIVPSFGSNGIVFNVDETPYDDVRVRRALALAVDADFIARVLLDGVGFPTRRILQNENTPGHDVAHDYGDRSMEDRRAEALALLTEAGFGPDNPLAVVLSAANGTEDRLVPVIQADWTAIAPWVRVDLVRQDRQAHYADVAAGDFEVFLGGAIWDRPHLQLAVHLAPDKDAGWGWPDPRYTGLLREAARAPDLETRIARTVEAERLVMAEHVIAPIWRRAEAALVDPSLTGWVDNPYDLHLSRHLCRE